MTVALIYRILVLLFLVFHKLRIKQTARFGNPFGLQTSLIFYGLVLQRTPSFLCYKLNAGQNSISAQPRNVISAMIMAESTIPFLAMNDGLSP